MAFYAFNNFKPDLVYLLKTAKQINIFWSISGNF